MAHRIGWNDGEFLVEFFGEVSAEEIESVNYEFCGDERFDTVRNAIWDMSRISRLTMADTDVEFAAANDKGASIARPVLKGAMVVADDHVRNLVEKYLELARQLDCTWETRVFDNIDSARRWVES